MFVVKTFFVGLLLLTAITQSQAEIDQEQTHHQWKSGVISPGGTIRFRAFTGHVEGSTYVVLAFDRLLESCSLQSVSLNILLPADANPTYSAKQYFGVLRVDEAVMHNITYTMGPPADSESGRKFVVVTLQNFDKEATILQELERGKDIRFKLADDFYLRFSLSGFTSASTQSMRLCIGFNGYKNENPDKSYFGGGNTRVKDDKNYFRY